VPASIPAAILILMTTPERQKIKHPANTDYSLIKPDRDIEIRSVAHRLKTPVFNIKPLTRQTYLHV
jgi:hypothetical protein